MSVLPPGYELRAGADPEAAQAFLTHTVWASGVTLAQVERMLGQSIVVSIWHGGKQVGMARVLTDHYAMAYLNDVYVLPEHRGQGLASVMVEHLRGHADLSEVVRWALFTQDAQELYARFGWRQYPHPDRFMVIDPRVFPA